MIQRVGVSINEDDLKHVAALQKRFGISNRSEFFRVLVRRYEALEAQLNALQQCLKGYAKYPDATEETLAIVRDSLRHEPAEDWQ
jgi:metal-responsive CopG/Arc/MetJ family transcriptional regulator